MNDPAAAAIPGTIIRETWMPADEKPLGAGCARSSTHCWPAIPTAASATISRASTGVAPLDFAPTITGRHSTAAVALRPTPTRSESAAPRGGGGRDVEDRLKDRERDPLRIASKLRRN